MTLKTFERAVEGLCVRGLLIDEVHLWRGQVREAQGHTDETIIRWDELGRAFSTAGSGLDPVEGRFSDLDFRRDAAYDLRTE